MADSFKQQEFVKCQAAGLLSRLPVAVRQSLRYYEVAALVEPFQPQPPLLQGPALGGKSFWYVVVTDWSLFLVSMSGNDERSIALELPFLYIRNMVSSRPVPLAPLTACICTHWYRNCTSDDACYDFRFQQKYSEC